MKRIFTCPLSYCQFSASYNNNRTLRGTKFYMSTNEIKKLLKSRSFTKWYYTELLEKISLQLELTSCCPSTLDLQLNEIVY